MSAITNDLAQAVTVLRNGGITAIPTETVYGLAGNAENEQAIRQIYALKNRPLNHPLIMHVARNWELDRWVSFIPDYARQLMAAFWPGPLTLVFQAKPGAVNPLVTGGQDTVAIRCPAHPAAQALLAEVAFPLVAPSANPFGKVSPTTAEHVQYSFSEQDLLILDGGRCPVGIESTIISALDPDHYQILRPGMIDERAIQAIITGELTPDNSAIRVPGKLKSHYQPEKPLYCFDDYQQIQQFCQQNPDCYVLSFTKNRDFSHHLGFQLPVNADEMAYELYYQLRVADQSTATAIAIELPPASKEWEGVRERIIKASQPM
ncbi:L-threonylcarbamoyladenylate synthase [Legionella dresdenensis]|uniref:Threonylcarbamoyl-AMP synthase n=1 Tax=Legionella dresdenensis TaxID=450200 RepID=A0ABV8CFW7_9GAMM